MSLNKSQLIGRLGADPETRAFPDGGSICTLSVATTESWKDKQSGERKERTEWHRCVLRNKLGEIAQTYLKKGSQVYLEGSSRTRKWQDQSGNDRYSTEVIVRDMEMLDSKGAANDAPAATPSTPAPTYGAPSGGQDDYSMDDKIPF